MGRDREQLWKEEEKRKTNRENERKALASDRNHESKPDPYPDEDDRDIQDRMLNSHYSHRTKSEQPETEIITVKEVVRVNNEERLKRYLEGKK